MRKFRFQGRAAAIAVAITLSLASGQKKSVYSPREKAFYADASAVQFVRPGLTFKITSAQVATDGTVTATISITDPAGLPLDRTGLTTPGAAFPVSQVHAQY